MMQLNFNFNSIGQRKKSCEIKNEKIEIIIKLLYAKVLI